MNRNEQPRPTSYAEANELLAGRSTLKIANNTYLEKLNQDQYGNPDVIVVRLHATDIVTFYTDGTTKLRSGGWRSNTTIERINRYLPNRAFISQQTDKWFFAQYPNEGATNEPVTPYIDGMVIDSTTGEVLRSKPLADS